MEAPAEEIPCQAIDAEASDWETDDEPVDGEGLYKHLLSSNNTPPPKHWRVRRPDYRSRIEAERRHWSEQQEEITLAYMEWKVYGPRMEQDNEELEWFDCRVISLQGRHPNIMIFFG